MVAAVVIEVFCKRWYCKMQSRKSGSNAIKHIIVASWATAESKGKKPVKIGILWRLLEIYAYCGP